MRNLVVFSAAIGAAIFAYGWNEELKERIEAVAVAGSELVDRQNELMDSLKRCDAEMMRCCARILADHEGRSTEAPRGTQQTSPSGSAEGA